MFKTLHIAILSFYLLFGVYISFAIEDTDEFYEKGLEFKQAGEWDKAIQIWLIGAQTLQRQQKSDPRIGIGFIELATELNAKKYYEMASELYFWGFRETESQQNFQRVQEEVERLVPIITKEQTRKWRSLVKDDDPLIYEEINSFWLSKDPTPSTATNERLLEHWQRIAYARKNFKKARNTVYGTDERGLIYVKFGKPKSKRDGILGTNRASLKRWSDVLLYNDPGMSERRNPLQQSVLLEEIDRFNNYPEYEIWFYSSLDSDETIFFLFGNREGVGRFGLRNGVEGLIPRHAFRTSMSRAGGINPGSILQSLYYSELMSLHSYFENRYHDLEAIWDRFEFQGPSSTVATNNSLKLKRRQYEAIDQTQHFHARVPPDQSDFSETVSAVDLTIYPFRFWRDDHGPMLALITFSYPKIKSKFFSAPVDGLIPEYSITHTLLIQDENAAELERRRETLPTSDENTSTLIFPHHEIQKEYLLISEAFNSEIGEDEISTEPQIIGIGRKTIPGLAPLTSKKTLLELSDLLIGVSSPSESQSKRLPFPVVPSSQIMVPDLLKVYLEIYHLYFDGEGTAHYIIDFRVAKLKGKRKKRDESISISFNFDAVQQTSKEQFEIDISKLTAGNYELVVEVTDKVSAQKKQRRAEFKVIKPD